MRIFEMTEFEWFNWWPFVLMSALVCVSLTLVTVRKIPLTRINLGVWMIHSGVVMMCLGSAYYFLTKVEGDTPVIRRQIIATAPGVEPVSLIALPGNAVQVGDYLLQVTELQPDWPILSGDDAGKRAYSVSVSVRTPERSFVRQMLAGYPQYTEDVIPGQGRAVKVTGEALVDPDLQLELVFAPQDEFFLKDTRALYVRPAGGGEWSMRTLSGLPRYNDYFGSLADVWVAPGEEPAPDPIDVRAVPTGDDALAGVDVRVTGFLRYAFEQERWSGGGAAHYPVVDFSLVGQENRQQFTLAAFDPEQSSTPGGEIRFLWVDTEAGFDALKTTTPPEISITVAPTGDVAEADTSVTLQDSPRLAWTTIGEGGYAYRVRRFDHTPVGSFAAVDLRTPDGEFTRWISPEGETLDLPIGSSDETDQLDEHPDIAVAFAPGHRAPPLAIVAGPDPSRPPRVLISPDGSTVRVMQAQPGQPLVINERIQLVLERYSTHAQFETRPAIVPHRQRQRDAGELFSMIRVQATENGVTESRWLPYNQYVLPSLEYTYQGRFHFAPVTMTLPSGRAVDLLFSRVRKDLPAPVVLDEFVLTAHVGGFTGQTASIRDWTSEIRFLQSDGEWTGQMPVSTNKPAEYKGYWFFQASWDPPQPQQGSAGMNFTGLGVGNRNGVYTMLAGSTLSVIGMLYAFYIKPVLKRRRAQQVLASLEEARANAGAENPETEPELTPAGA
jgi:hypothetical protein